MRHFLAHIANRRSADMLSHFADRATKVPAVDPHEQRKAVSKIATGIADPSASFIDVRKDPKAIPSAMNRARDVLAPLLYGIFQSRRQVGKHHLDPQPTPHDLRHSFGSWLAEAGVPPHEIQALMGHSTLRAT